MSDLKAPKPSPEPIPTTGAQKETSASPKSTPTPTPTQAPEAKPIRYGIDVSKWQGKIDWKKVKEAGVEFAMIRVGYRTLQSGIIYEDPYADYNLKQAIANGIPVGVYFFSTAKNKEEVLQEAQWVAKYIAPYKITYPVVYDCEGY
ncbi:MAG: glycoside hydrolase family 25, partial [Clostridiales bacterium]|nr:glycoside hydrolase family 25 [Clostridiales bacterium]